MLWIYCDKDVRQYNAIIRTNARGYRKLFYRDTIVLYYVMCSTDYILLHYIPTFILLWYRGSKTLVNSQRYVFVLSRISRNNSGECPIIQELDNVNKAI